MYQYQLTPQNKESLKGEAQSHISSLNQSLQDKIEGYTRAIEKQRDLIPQFRETNLKSLDPDNEQLAIIIAKINLYEESQLSLSTIQGSPYFLRLDLTWADTAKRGTIYISKHSLPEENIFSWVSPISALRFFGIGEAEYTKPSGDTRKAQTHRKDDLIVTSGQIVFMTHETETIPRQVVFQKHMDERKEFMLPEIVAEMDRLQDQIIRTSPEGGFLISGPAGSGKTTLALHRIAYLVLTPEFKDFFQPEKIIVFVADERATAYFGNLLPELGIKGVRVTTFMEWACMIANSRFRARLVNRFRPQPLDAAIEFLETHNPFEPLHPQVAQDEFRKYKQQLIMPLRLKEGSQSVIFRELHSLYENALSGLDHKVAAAFRSYLKFQKDNKYLDEVDLTIILMSLEFPVTPFAHVVIDEVQNYFPEQLQVLTNLVSRRYMAVSFIGDIRQKTKAFAIQDWYDLDPKLTSEEGRKVELLKVYRNTKPILEYLAQRGFEVDPSKAREGRPVELFTPENESAFRDRVIEAATANPNVQVGVLAKYKSLLAGLGHMEYDFPNLHVMSIAEAQGLEFHTVVLLDQGLDLPESEYAKYVGWVSAEAYQAQDQHLLYVAITRAQESLVVVTQKSTLTGAPI